MYDTTSENITYQVISEFAKTIEMFGLSPLEARLFVYLYLQDQPKTLDEMSEALGKSKTSMSTSIRSLSDYSLVTLVWKKGVRKDLYAANDQLFKTFMNNYVNKWIDASNHQKDALGKIRKQLKNRDKEQSPDILNNLNKIIDFHKQIESAFHRLQQN
ncbi:DNA-binding transcriptional regulator GbsR, MarR family [Lentibacillus halodurans]|uniref:HTH-type transcriptional regulator n=1 Tax=Lentibacillus halodurans TaxID=237679 RepID=A0A1I0VYD7_9BACI|nr:helix-turn-helix domain-containing protein [Lentibacillus halodurans]SFA81429.1 DNA-binding transcriptional regulator GbsR, MarR family [Lentibacillus halodurans]